VRSTTSPPRPTRQPLSYFRSNNFRATKMPPKKTPKLVPGSGNERLYNLVMCSSGLADETSSVAQRGVIQESPVNTSDSEPKENPRSNEYPRPEEDQPHEAAPEAPECPSTHSSNRESSTQQPSSPPRDLTREDLQM